MGFAQRVRHVAIAGVAGAAALAGSALAGEEKPCADQYSFEEQTTLEWAALGGDPHAQFALAQCALPKGAKNLGDLEKDYAVKWVTLAACDAEGGPHVAARDRMLRGLREEGDISFRRFGGVTENEKFDRREKRFREYREYKTNELMARFERLGEAVSDTERARGKDLIADDLARLGPLGLLRLSSLAVCPYFNGSAPFTAAAYSATADAWRDYSHADVYGEPQDRRSLEAVAAERLDGLSGAQRETAKFEQSRLMRTSPKNLATLEEKAALGRLQELSFVGGAFAEAGFQEEFSAHLRPISGPSVTMAVQYALEAMGLMQFQNGPDNDYGPATIEAAARAQALYGREPTRWLTNEEARQIVCDAATDKGDPISYYHLGVMFSRGWGFPVDLVRARYAITRAESALDAQLADFEELPAWKQRAYPAFRAQIEAARAAINSAWTTTPEREKASWAGRLSDENLCQ